MTALFWLLVGHFVADFPLQTDHIAKFKNRRNRSEPPQGQRYQPVWTWVMSAHAATHAGAVALATGNVAFGCAEFILHWGIDAAKCENLTDPAVDQILHIACKVVYAALLWGRT